MTIIKEENTIMPESIEKIFNYSEFFDIGRFFVPAECQISEKKIAW
ncbi:MAG: hypothetical protein ACTSRI_05445 [Promethearchaeota archaeon]